MAAQFDSLLNLLQECRSFEPALWKDTCPFDRNGITGPNPDPSRQSLNSRFTNACLTILGAKV